MVVRYRERLCMWESGRDDLDDVIKDKRIRGVHLVVLDDILEAYTHRWEGDFVVRQLNRDLEEARLRTLEQWLPGMSGKPFPALWQIAIDQLEARLNPAKFNRDTYACAELIADTYQRMSLLPLDRTSESFSARDFSASARLPLQFDFALADEILVTYTPPPPPRYAKDNTMFIQPPREIEPKPSFTADSILLP